jgi:ParB family transcriptional regulator, chromosome partitioning protein
VARIVDILLPVLHSSRMAKPALGRGLGALLGGSPPAARPVIPAAAPITSTSLAAVPVAASSDGNEQVRRVALDRVRPCPFQPRKEFAPEALLELADSIKEQGIIQPLIVREKPDGFELIAGERRWRAAQMAGLKEVPVLVREADDRAVLELALIENLQRENLNPIEEAQGYAELIGTFQLRQEDVSSKVGKSRAVVANALRLLKLPVDVQAPIRDGRLSVGHAKVILGLPGADEQKLAAERVLKESLNVRQTEELVTRLQANAQGSHAPGRNGGHSMPVVTDVHVANLEGRLRERFGTKVQLRYRAGKGALDIRFYSDDELERILQIMGVPVE